MTNRPAQSSPPVSFATDSLEAALREQLGHPTGVFSLTQLKGGQSNPTYTAHFGTQRYVIRKKPPGQLLPSAHQIEREFQVMAALAKAHFPVPEMHWLCEDATLIGTPFYVMAFLDGRIFYDPRLPDQTSSERSAIHDAVNAVQASLHQVDYAAIGLATYGKPGNYFSRQIDRWSKQYRASELTPIAAMNQLMDWLPTQVPEGDEVSIVHGDYRLDNLVFHPTEAKVIGVLDWELSTLGHPLADFSYHAMAWRIPSGIFRGLAGEQLAGTGIPSERDYIAAYCRRTGRGDIAHWPFYLAFNLFRLASIIQGVAKRAVDGNANAENAREMGTKVAPLGELAWSIAQGRS